MHFYRADTVTDLNGQGIGGMPALFKSFTSRRASTTTSTSRRSRASGSTGTSTTSASVIGQRPWDGVVMHGYSTLDAHKPGDPAHAGRHGAPHGGAAARAQPGGARSA